MTLSQLQIFLTLVQTGSFTKTGEVLGMSQSAVSHAVASLESEFGTSLIVRERKNSLTLSNSGERLIVHIREIMRRVGLMTEEIASIKGIESGTIRIGSCPETSVQVLPRILAKFRQQHPDIEIAFTEGTTEDVLEWVSTHVIDVGLVVSLSSPENSVPLYTDPMIALLPCSFRCDHVNHISIRSLRDEPFIRTKSDYGTVIQEVFDEQGIEIQTIYEVRDVLAAARMVHEGLGFTIVPESLVSTANLLDVQIRHLEPLVSITLSITASSFDEASPTVRSFTEIAKTIHNTL